MIYTELSDAYHRDGTVTCYEYTYCQPAWCYWRWQAYELWSKLSWRPLAIVEKLPSWWHHRRCNGCTMGTICATGERVPMCGYLPWCARQDLRAYELSTSRRTTLGEKVLSVETRPTGEST